MSATAETISPPSGTNTKTLLMNQLTIVLGFIGIGISGMLSYLKVINLVVPCVSGNNGCALVEMHPISQLYGLKIYIGFLGLAGYIILTGLALARTMVDEKGWNSLLKAGLIFSIGGTIFSFYLTFVALTIMRAECIWCLASALTMSGICVLHALMLSNESPKVPAKFPALGAGAGLIIALGIFGGAVSQAKSAGAKTLENVSFKNVTVEQMIPGPDKLIGSPDAPIVLVELADVNCPACRQIHPAIKKLVAESNGKIAYGFRSFPLSNIPGHEQSLTAAILSEYAASEGKYMDFVNACFMEENTSRIKSKEGLLGVAEEVGLDPKASKEVSEGKHAASETFLEGVSDNITLGRTTGILVTPSFIIITKDHEPQAVAGSDLADALGKEPYRSLLK